EQLLKIQVVDVSEVSSIENIELAPATIPENSPAGTRVGSFATLLKGGLRIPSQDSSISASYEFISGSGDSGNALFTITGNKLTSNRPFDHELEPFTSIRVLSKTSEGESMVKSLQIQILDVFENTPPTFTSFEGKELVELTFLENKQVVGILSATDPDDQILTYALMKEADYAAFTLSSATGLLTFAEKPDFENPKDANQNNVYEVGVLVSDGIKTDLQRLRITILDDGL
ncbi:uncharacterized protein METZ01_LOCUS511980, partial [marine metagenome]